MGPEEIRNAIIEILEDISPDEDLSKLDDAQSFAEQLEICLLYTSPSPRDATLSRMPSSA